MPLFSPLRKRKKKIVADACWAVGEGKAIGNAAPLSQAIFLVTRSRTVKVIGLPVLALAGPVRKSDNEAPF